MTKSFVYWLYNSTCGLIEETGYVGVSVDPKVRFKTHIYEGRLPADIVMSILFEGTREECENKELELRPDFNIGWNRVKGGRRGSIGGTATKETRAKLSKANMGKVLSKEHREKLSKAHTGKVLSKEHREKIRKAGIGRIHSQETRDKIRKAASGVVRSDETRDKLSKVHKGKVVSKETREKLSKAGKRRIHSQATRAKMSETHLRNHAAAQAQCP